MEVTENVRHKFNLSGMQAGDWFLGCRHCWYQLPVRAAARIECPECGAKMCLYDVTPYDLCEQGTDQCPD